MSRKTIVIWSAIIAIGLGIILVGTMVYIADIQRQASVAAAVERTQFEASQTAFAQGIR